MKNIHVQRPNAKPANAYHAYALNHVPQGKELKNYFVTPDMNLYAVYDHNGQGQVAIKTPIDQIIGLN